MAGISINSSVASLGVLRQLDRSSKTVSTAFERLSSGLRINRASDDPAGLAVSAGLNVDARVYSQAIRNTNDGISLLNIAEGTTEQLTGILIRMRELATQSANGTLGVKQRRALDSEGAALSSEFNRLVASTKMNGLNLLTGTETVGVQLGYGSRQNLALQLGDGLERNVGGGQYNVIADVAFDSTSGVAVGDLNGDGFVDIAGAAFSGVSIGIGFNDGQGNFINNQVLSPNNFFIGPQFADFNGDGKLDLVATDISSGTKIYFNNGSGTFSSQVTVLGFPSDNLPLVGDFNNDGKADLAASSGSGGSVAVMLGNGNGTFSSRVNLNDPDSGLQIASGDFNGDGNLDIVANAALNDLTVYLGNGVGGFNVSGITRSIQEGTVATGDVNFDGYADIVSTSNSGAINLHLSRGDGTFTTSSLAAGDADAVPLLADLNGDGILDLTLTSGSNTKFRLGAGNGTFGADQTIGMAGSLTNLVVADANNDGATDIFISGSGDIQYALATPTQTTTIQRMSLLTRVDALGAIGTIDAALRRVQKERGNIGANSNRLSTALSNLQSTRDGYIDSASRITDADIAGESSTLIRAQILQQAGSAVLAQANLVPEIALQLLAPSR